ncbi:FAD-dependent oxidoreductase [Ornithinicoccus halotolerans]|uniref:FAD-dependent oxidoreductase n=1 Tax=Ornithinicoccus halotolerans TaxID=1748220 RepID=UPI00129751F5|nr:FAD-dependent oxidoreductase [Ornithinicoccus halotolerans]
MPGPVTHLDTDVAVIGGGLGGVAAALAAASRGHRVVLSEETDWVGGQLTAQGVPPDEHPWIEQFGCTARYRRLRDEIRSYYRRWYPLSERARRSRHLNPGLGTVSGLCVEPRVGVAVLEAMLAPHRSSGRLRVLLGHRPTAAATDGDRVTGVTLAGPDGERVHVAGRYVLDATETGELLELAAVEHRTGAESQAQTGEPSAPAAAQPLAMQAVSWCFALEHRAGEDHTTPRPQGYAHWRDHCPPGWTGGPLLSFTAPVPRTGEPLARTLVPNPDEHGGGVADHRTVGGDFELWRFRRIAARASFAPGHLDSDVTLVNWPMIDYLAGPVYGEGPAAAARHQAGARELSLSFLHWLQTEAPRPDGGTGWPGLRLRPDVMGTTDGLAKAAYIRESRRAVTVTTIREQDVALAHRPDGLGRPYPDSVGVGSYRIDLHPTTGGHPYLDVASCPFQLPLRALLPVRSTNLLPAAKNIGTTHITNGCYRLHPVEWNVGEVAGELAAHCLEHGLVPHAVADRPERVEAFQQQLVAAGVELAWPQVRGY